MRPAVRLLLPALLLGAALLARAQEPAAVATRGRAVYLAEACWQCHVQEHDRTFPELGVTERTGPVLGATRVQRSRAWHLAHLHDPRAVVAGSVMPEYGRRFARHPREADVGAFVARYDDGDGIVTRLEFEAAGGGDWAAALADLDGTGNGVVSRADAAPQPDAGLAALADYLVALEPDPPAAEAPPAVPASGGADPAAAIRRGRALFLRHCAGCHGAEANGDGPAAVFFPDHPPRNFVRGEYKFRSTPTPDPPLDADLFRTIRRGAGGSMPAWPGLADRQVRDLVAYLKCLHPGYLTVELFVEGRASVAFVQGTEDEPSEVDDATGVALEGGRVEKRHGVWLWNGSPITNRMAADGYRFRLGREVYDWMAGFAPHPVPIPEPPFAYSEASARKGEAVYEQLQCGKCHGDTGRGDGDAADQTRGPRGAIDRPADYTRGFKGGGDPRSLVRTFLTGLHGTPMPSYAGNFASDDDLWHLAHFVMRQARAR